MALNGAFCADVPLRNNYSLTQLGTNPEHVDMSRCSTFVVCCRIIVASHNLVFIHVTNVIHCVFSLYIS